MKIGFFLSNHNKSLRVAHALPVVTERQDHLHAHIIVVTTESQPGRKRPRLALSFAAA